MTLLAGTAWTISWIGAGLLVLAGVAKLRRPEATTDTLALAGLPDHPLPARLLGLGEVTVAVVVLATSAAWAVGLLGAAHAVFAAVSGHLLRTDRGSCGCFGEVAAPLSRMHVATNVMIALAAAVAATTPAPVPTSTAALVLLAAVVATGAGTVRTMLVLVPAVADSIRRLAPS